jgi:gamma-glutamylputrescine oxidase
VSERVWEDGNWSPLPSLEGDASCDVCVVGLGGSGLSAVHELLDLGVSVVGIDARAVAAGAAGSNGGFLLAGCYHFYHDAVAQYGRDRALAIYRLTLVQLTRIAAETPAAVRPVGSLRIAASDDERADCLRQLEAMVADGFAVHRYIGPEGDGLLVPSDAAFDPLLRCRLLARRALARGAALYEDTPALRVTPGSVMTHQGTITCGAVIVALDGALPLLLRELVPRVRIARLQMLATAPAPEVSIPRPVYRRFGMDYWQQLPDGRVAIGGFRDLGGDDEWTRSTDTTTVIQDALEEQLRAIGVTAPVTHRWAASVGYTADGLPVCEEVAERVWAVGAYSGTGNVIGALCGRAAARALVLGDTAFAAPLLSAS